MYISYSGKFAFPFIMETMKFAFCYLDINVNVINNSELNSKFDKGDLVLDLCKKTNADIYLSGQGAKNYLTVEQIKKFEKDNIILEWHKFKHPVYPQHKKFDFVSGLACLDLFFWNGKEKSRKILWENVKR